MSQGAGEAKIQSPSAGHTIMNQFCPAFRTNVPILGREFNGLFVPENANGLLELLGVERFL
jgi:hypothetical protein